MSAAEIESFFRKRTALFQRVLSYQRELPLDLVRKHRDKFLVQAVYRTLMANGCHEEVAAFEAETRIRPEPFERYEIQKQWVPPKSDDWYRFVDFYSSNLDTPLPENSYHEDAAWSLHLDVIERRADQYDWYWSHHLPVWSEEVFRRFGHKFLASGRDQPPWLCIPFGKFHIARYFF